MQKLITIKTDKTQVAAPIGEIKFEVDLEKGSVQISSMRTQEKYGELKNLLGITSDELTDYLKNHPEQLLLSEAPTKSTSEDNTTPEKEETKQEDKSSE